MPTAGPNNFPVSVRITNTGVSAVTNLLATFVWDTANTFINLDGAATRSISSLSAGAHVDVWFGVQITQNASAYDTARRYHITVTSDNAATVSTPTPRQLYVEHLVSQNRNSVNANGIVGPTNPTVGDICSYTVTGSTATNGYEELEGFLYFDPSVFKVISCATSFAVPTSYTGTQEWADAGGWDSNPSSGTYRSVIGPSNIGAGKVGGSPISITYSVEVIGTGSKTLRSLIYDFSGSSFHYNSDFLDLDAGLPTVSSPPSVCVAGFTLVTLDNGREMPIRSLRAGQSVVSNSGKRVAVRGVVECPAGNQLVRIAKHSFNTVAPSQPLWISAGHPMLVCGVFGEVDPMSLVSQHPGVHLETSLPDGERTLFTVVTERREFIMMQGVAVSTWSMDAWENFTASDPRGQALQWKYLSEH